MSLKRFKKKVDGAEQSTPALLTFETLILPVSYQVKALCPQPYAVLPLSGSWAQNLVPLRKIDYLECVLTMVLQVIKMTTALVQCCCYYCKGAHKASSKQYNRSKFEKEEFVIRNKEKCRAHVLFAQRSPLPWFYSDLVPSIP